MAIQSIEAYSVVLRYQEPFRIAPSTTVESHNVIVKIVTDFGVTGIGESSPSDRVTHETPRTVIETLDKIAPNLIGMYPLRIEQISETMDELVAENPSAKAAIDIALHDILGKVARKPLFRLIGGFRDAILTDLTLGIKAPDEMASDAVKAVAAIREASQIPLMADESVHTPEDALHLIKENAVDMINIKLMKSGGILKARKIAVIAEAANVPCMIGCMGESTVGITAGVHLATALKNIQYADLDSDILIADKLVSKGGAELVASQRIPSMKPGLGIVKLKDELLGHPLRVYK